ncbi:MAG: hypothetical protein KatS3mg106_230 [Gemmataceae bacterium]|nr:MAG: hypothetical protein KatS3mg106_230 [Gemmataceae bacterium]
MAIPSALTAAFLHPGHLYQFPVRLTTVQTASFPASFIPHCTLWTRLHSLDRLYFPVPIVLPRGCLMMPECRYDRASMAWGVRRGVWLRGSCDEEGSEGRNRPIARMAELGWTVDWNDPASGPAEVRGRGEKLFVHKVQWRWPDRGLFAAIVPVLAGASRFPPERHRCRDRCGCRRWRRCNRPDR